ncbi:MAG: hypothetical protein IKA99_00575, partial [Clostridia bacterium]|nr:hypothetical protein [Clostridia bacterium]
MNYNLLSSTIYGAIITIISFGIIALFIFFGVKRGFTKTFIKDFGALFSLIFALLLCSTVVNFLERTYSSVKSFSMSISGLMDNMFGKEVMDLHAGNVNSTNLQGILSSWLINTIINLIGANNNIENVPLREVVSPVFSYYIISFIVIIVLFILFRIIFYIIGKEFE